MAKGFNVDAIRVAGTSPLSFELKVGMELQVREFGPSPYSRPSVGGRFRSNAYLIYSGGTKIGRLTPAIVDKLGGTPQKTCTVVKIDPNRKILIVSFR